MTVKIRLAVRDWDYLTPLVLGEVRAEGVELQVDRVAALPDDLATDPHYDAAEMSMSRYCLGRARGEDAVVGLPNFLMRAFRLRCIVTTKNSKLMRLADLKGKRVGIAGWQDSGNTWTRALLRREAVAIDDIYWAVSRLMANHPITDRVGRYARPGRIETVKGDMPLMELLVRGEIDAVFMPFMPPGFFAPDSAFRQLMPDFRAAELAYFRDVGYVPGIHLLGVKAELAARAPQAARALSAAIDRSTQIWLERRQRYADTTPWIIDELLRVGHDLPVDWNRSGYRANAKMIADFCAELEAQALTPSAPAPESLFPLSIEVDA